MRILFVEPHGEGGICHYTYCLSTTLQKQGCQVILSTGHPYELVSAQRPFALATPFGSGRMRRVIQVLSKSSRRGKAIVATGTLAPALNGGANDFQAPKRSPRAGLAGQVSRWLALREYRSGWKQVVRLAQQQQIKVVHIQWLSHPEHDVHWLETLHRNKVRVVFTAHSTLPHDAPASACKVWQRVYQSIDMVIAHHQEAEDELKALGVNEQRITIMPPGNFIPISALASAGTDILQGQTASRLLLGLPAESPVALFFGLMRPYKGVEYLLEAFSRVRQECPGAKLLLVGRAPEGFDQFASKISELGLEHACVAVPRYLPLSEVAHYFLAADVVVLPYSKTIHSGVLQLAYGFQRPVIATQVGNFSEAVISGKTGSLVPPRDVDALTRALVELLSDRQRCKDLGKHAYELAEERYSWEHVARATQEVYQRLAQHI